MGTPQVTSTLSKVVPAGAAGAAITPSGTNWAYSSWVVLTTGLASAITIVGVIVNGPDTVDIGEFEIEIGKGAAGAEAIVGRTGGVWAYGAANSWGGHFFPFGVPIDNIAAATRIAARLRKKGTNTVQWTVKLVYFDTIAAAVGVTANIPDFAPSGADGVSITPSGTAWANSAWVQQVASTPAAIVLSDVVAVHAVNVENELDVGKGVAGSETVVATHGDHREANHGQSVLAHLGVPIDNIPASTRVAMRVRKAGTDTTGVLVGYTYYEKPL